MRTRHVGLLPLALIATAVFASSVQGAARPNLQVGSVSNPPSTAEAGATFTVSDQTRNAGTGRVGRSTVQFFLSRDTKRSSDDIRLGTQKVAALGAGRRFSSSIRLHLPSVPVTASYYVLACADAAGKVKESNERDNCRASRKPVAVRRPAGPTGPTPTTTTSVTPTPVPTTTSSTPPPPPPAAPTVDVKADGADGPVLIATGATATLTWTSTGATSCTASDGWTGARATSGTEPTAALGADTTFKLTCAGPGGTTSDSVKVTVGTDLDGDGVPDATDCAPLNSGLPPVGHHDATACTASIYEIENGTVPVGAAVWLRDVLVTAVGPGTHIFVGHKSGDPEWTGSYAYSAIEVDAGAQASSMHRGDRIDLIGVSAQTSHGLIVTADPGAIDVVSSLNEAVPPDVVSATDFTTPAHIAGLDAVLVQVAGVSITAQAGGDWTVGTPSFGVTHDLIGTLPTAAVGAPLTTVTGIADVGANTATLAPRISGDVVFKPVLTGFTLTAPACILVGQSNTMIGTVTLDRPAQGNTPVTVSSGDAGSLSITGGSAVVPDGQTTATVSASGLAAAPSVTLTATLGTTMLTAPITVHAADNPC